MRFPDSHITLIGDDGDKFKATVRDDLTGLNFFRMSIKFWRVI